MAKEQGSFREKAGNYAILGGIIAGFIGLIANAELILAGFGLMGSGYILKNTAKKP